MAETKKKLTSHDVAMAMMERVREYASGTTPEDPYHSHGRSYAPRALGRVVDNPGDAADALHDGMTAYELSVADVARKAGVTEEEVRTVLDGEATDRELARRVLDGANVMMI